jgi:bifunctional lysine-specific demethylase and histidyl-hydroxylase NO66
MSVDGWTESPSLVTDILGVEDLEQFLDGHWEKSPRRVRGVEREKCRQVPMAIRGLLDLPELEQLIASAGGAPDSATNIIEGYWARPVSAAPGDPRLLTVPVDAFARGASLLIPAVHHRLSRIAQLCRQFDNAMLASGVPLAQPTQANAYATPRGGQGFGAHYDNHCAVILQLHGLKTWTIHAPAEELPTSRCADIIPDGQLGSVVMTVRMEPGDVLYVPRGFPHSATAHNEVSLHLTLGIFAATWSDLVKSVATDSPALRAAVRPRTGSGMSATQFYRDGLVAALAGADPADVLQRKLADSLTGLPPLPGRRLQDSTRLADITPTCRLVRSKLVLAMVRREDGQAVLRCPGVRIALPGALLPALEFVADSESFSLSEIPAGGAEFDRADLVRRLVSCGLLTIDADVRSDGVYVVEEPAHGAA